MLEKTPQLGIWAGRFYKKRRNEYKMKEYLNPTVEVTYWAKADVLTYSVNENDVTGKDVEWEPGLIQGN